MQQLGHRRNTVLEMKVKIITIPALDALSGEQELNQFLNAHRIIAVEKQFFQITAGAFWSFVINYMDQKFDITQSKRATVDYKSVLSDDDFNNFARLRELRNTLAKQQGRPAYAIFTNEQLANMVTESVTSKTQLSDIDGVGSARIEQYADHFLPLLREIHGEDK